MRAIFFDEDDAAAVVARLRADGFEATMERERLAGEDDDEDHPWAVLSDAPAFMLELLVDSHDAHDWALALERVVADPAYRDRLATGALVQAEQFSWEATAAQTLAVYQRAHSLMREEAGASTRKNRPDTAASAVGRSRSMRVSRSAAGPPCRC